MFFIRLPSDRISSLVFSSPLLSFLFFSCLLLSTLFFNSFYPISLLLFIPSFTGSWYDRADVSLKKNIVNTQYVCCMNHKSGSFSVCPRLQHKFVTLAVPAPIDSQLRTLFGTILQSHFYNFQNEVQGMCRNLTDAVIAAHKDIALKFPPSGMLAHMSVTI